MVFAQKPARLKAAMTDILENAEADLTSQMRNLIDMLWSEWKLVERQIDNRISCTSGFKLPNRAAP